MWIAIDDNRDWGCDIVARNAEGGTLILSVLKNLSAFEGLCLDHDLGPGKSGYDVLKWGLENDLIPKHVQLVTMNPVGRNNMALLLEEYGYESTDRTNFYKQ